MAGPGAAKCGRQGPSLCALLSSAPPSVHLEQRDPGGSYLDASHYLHVNMLVNSSTVLRGGGRGGGGGAGSQSEGPIGSCSVTATVIEVKRYR